MNQQFVSLIEQAQSAEVVTSFGADADTRVSPKVVTAVYRVLETILLYPF
ncbi:hypothetical protein [Pseudoxanthomonas mexicana]